MRPEESKMSQESSLIIKIDATRAKQNADELSQELTKLFIAGENASKSAENLGVKLQTTSSATKKMGSAANDSINSIQKQTKEFEKQEQQVSKNSLAIKEMAKVIAGYITIDKGIAMADGYTQYAARIRNATISAEEYNLVQDRLLATANTTFRALSEAQEVYLSLSGGMKSLGYSTKQTLDLSDSLSFAFTANATRADQAQSAMDSLAKSMAKGKIDADAWISIVTGADNIIADMAKTTGKTETEIRQLGATGKASLEDLIKTLVSTREQNEVLANSMENSVADGLTKLSNETTVFLGKLNEGTKATGTLAAGLGFLGENMDKLAIVGGIAASIYGGRLVAALVLSTQKTIAKTAATVAQAGAMTTATTAAKGLYLALGGPVGLAIGIAGTIASMYLMKDVTGGATAELESQKKTVKELTEEYKKLNTAQLVSKQEEIKKAIKDADDQVKVATMNLERMAKIRRNATLEEINQAQQLKNITRSVKDGMGANEAANQMVRLGFSEGDITKATKFFNVISSNRGVMAELKNQQALINIETGDFGNKLDANQKKVAESQARAKALTEDYSQFSNELTRNTEHLLQQAVALGLTKEKQDKVTEALGRFQDGQISAAQLAKILNENLQLPQGLPNSYTDLAGRVQNLKVKSEQANTEQERTIRIRDEYLRRSGEMIAAKDDETEAIKRQKSAYEDLNAEQQSAHDKIKTQIDRESYVQVNMKQRGVSRERAEYDADLRASAKMGFTNADGKMPESLRKIGEAGWQLKQDAEARTKAEQETLKAQQEQTKEAEKKTNALKALSLILQTNDERTRNMLMVYQSFRKAGLGDNQARVMTAQVGRENDFVTSKMYGSHQDKNNNYTNTGFLSWQKTRSKELIKYMGKNGLLAGGKITQGQQSLDAMARFAVSEMASDPYYAKTKNAMQQGNISYRELEKIVGKNFVGWDYVGNKLGKSTAAQHLSKQDGYYKKLSEMLGSDADGVMGVVSASIDKENAILQKQAELRSSIVSSILDEPSRIKTNLDKNLADVSAAGFTEDEAKVISNRLKAQAEADLAMYENSQKMKLESYSDFLRTEEQMLIKSFNQKAIIVNNDLTLTDDQRKDSIDFLKVQLKQEQAYLELAKEQRLFQMRQQFLTETQAMQERYRLEEAELIKVADLKEREFQRQMIRLRQEEESRARLQNAQMNWANVDAQMKGTTGRMQVEQDRFIRLDSSQQLFDAQMGAVDGGEQGALGRLQEQRNQDLITEQEFENQKTLILQAALETRQAIYDAHALRQTEVEEAYQKDSINLQLTQAQQLTGSFANMFRGILGESSGAYKTMYAMQQGFAIAQAGMNMWSSASSAYNDTQGTVWQKMAAAGKAVLDQGTFLAMIQAITPQGFATGGLVRGPGTGTSDSIPAWLSNEEFVVKARAVKSIGVENLRRMNETGELPQVHRERQQVSAIRQAEVKITIVNNTSQPVEATSDWKDGELQVILTEMRKQNEAMVDAKIAKNNIMSKRQGW